MILQFDTLHVDNFLSLGSVTLSLRDMEKATTLIMGENRDDDLASSNGAGKSSILEAITWALFGKTFRDLRYTDEIIRDDEESCLVGLEFSLGTDKLYRLLRTKQIYKAAELDIYLNKEKTPILKDATTKDKQFFLESLIGFSWDTFFCSVMFHQEFVAFPDLKPAERAVILTEVGNLSKYDDAEKIAKDFVKQFQESIQTKENKKVNFVCFLETLNKNLAITKVSNANYEKDREERLSKLANEIQSMTADMDEKVFIAYLTARELYSHINNLEDMIAEEEAKQQISTTNIVVRIEQLEAEEKAELKKCNSLDAEARTHTTYLNSLVTERLRIQRLEPGSKCPTCYQTITQDHAENCAQEIIKKESATQILIEEKRRLQSGSEAQMSRIKTALKEAKEQKSKFEAEAQKIILLKNALQERQIKAEMKIEQIEKVAIEWERYIKERRAEWDQTVNKPNPFQEVKFAQENQIMEKEKEIDDLNSSLLYLKDKLLYHQFWVTGFRKVKMMEFNSLVARLNELSQDYLSKFSSEVNITISGERQTKTGTKDEIHIEVESGGKVKSYGAYSGGERHKIKMAVSLAMAQMIGELCDRETNLLFFDEPNNNLDEIGKETNFQIFTDLAQEGKGIVVIDHDAIFQDRFDNILKAVRENRKTTIVKGD